MDMVPTLDILLSDPATDKARLALVARSAVAAAVADWAALRALQRELRPGDYLAGERSVAIALYRQHEAWLPAADALWQRVLAVAERVGNAIPGAEPLRDAIGRTTARLSIPLADVIAAKEDGLHGREWRFASVEEMRRELLHPDLPHQSQGPISTDGPVAAGGRS